MVELVIPNETDTVGNILQHFFLAHDTDVYFSAYHRIHPLKQEIKFVFETFPDTDTTQLIDSVFHDITELLTSISTQFEHHVATPSS